MGKPFDSGLARKATERTAELVDLLNRNLKEFRAELGPGKDSDIVITHLTDPPVNVFVEVEIVRGDRWERIRSGEFSTVRWPLAKRYKCENYAREGKLLIMLSANEDNLGDMFYIDCASWVQRGREERAAFVKAGGQKYRYRKGQEEPFWAVERDKVVWGVENLEKFLLNLMKSRN
jgi:hypothetical protein